MSKDPAQLENRLDALEEKLRLTFNQIEKKFDETQNRPAPATKTQFTGVQPHKINEMEERFARLEEKLKLTFIHTAADVQRKDRTSHGIKEEC